MDEKTRETESKARDRPIHKEDESISYVRVKLVWKDVTRVHAWTHVCILVDDWYTLKIPLMRRISTKDLIIEGIHFQKKKFILDLVKFNEYFR